MFLIAVLLVHDVGADAEASVNVMTFGVTTEPPESIDDILSEPSEAIVGPTLTSSPALLSV